MRNNIAYFHVDDSDKARSQPQTFAINKLSWD